MEGIEIKSDEKPEESLKELLKSINQKLDNTETKKIKKIKFRAKVKGSKMKKGWIGVLKIQPNRAITGEKVKVDEAAFTTKDGLTHAMNSKSIFWLEGKYPVIIQPTWRTQPLAIGDDIEPLDETAAQRYVGIKMLKNAAEGKKKNGMGSIVWIIVIVVAAYFIYTKFFGG